MPKNPLNPNLPPNPLAGMSTFNGPQGQNPPLGSLGGLVKTHTITTNPDGTQKHTVTHETGQKSEKTGLVNPKQLKNNPQKPQAAPEIKMIGGLHHVPFKHSDGSIKYINAHGGITS